MTDLGTLGGSYSFPSDINERGQIAGYSSTAADEIHGFVWQNGTMTDIGTLGGTYSSARAINKSGQVVGQSYTSSDEVHAFVWMP
jgi:probable HAF family extracellular repeat protein